MYCPRCGQEQASDKIRFCTKCALPMNGVKEILVPESRKSNNMKKKLQKSFIQGVALIIFGFALSMIFAVLYDFDLVPKNFAKISALGFCVLGMIRMGLPFISRENFLPEKKVALSESEMAADNLIETNLSGKSLSEAQYSPPINSGAKNYNTAELVAVPSVTENTTKLLKDELMQK